MCQEHITVTALCYTYIFKTKHANILKYKDQYQN